MTTIFHTANTRSIRVLWTLAELGVACEVKTTAFPPRLKDPDYLQVNPAGTLPAMIDGERVLTESMAICAYLVDKHGPSPLAVRREEAEWPEYQQWMWFGEATLTPPLGILARATRLGPGLDAVVADARDSFATRLTAIERRLAGRDFLAGGRLTLADVSCGYPLHLAGLLKCTDLFGPRVVEYWERLRARPAFQKAVAARG